VVVPTAVNALHGATETLKDDLHRSAKCACCNRTVLANDCFKIMVGPKDSPATEGGEEWNRLCRLAEANYCKENVALIARGPGYRTFNRDSVNRDKGWATFPDCDSSMVHPSGYRFFFLSKF
jgi:hypothetical protein